MFEILQAREQRQSINLGNIEIKIIKYGKEEFNKNK